MELTPVEMIELGHQMVTEGRMQILREVARAAYGPDAHKAEFEFAAEYNDEAGYDMYFRGASVEDIGGAALPFEPDYGYIKERALDTRWIKDEIENRNLEEDEGLSELMDAFGWETPASDGVWPWDVTVYVNDKPKLPVTVGKADTVVGKPENMREMSKKELLSVSKQLEDASLYVIFKKLRDEVVPNAVAVDVTFTAEYNDEGYDWEPTTIIFRDEKGHEVQPDYEAAFWTEVGLQYEVEYCKNGDHPTYLYTNALHHLGLESRGASGDEPDRSMSFDFRAGIKLPAIFIKE